MATIRRVGVLTAGGDGPGMNATIRGIVRTGEQNGIATVGFEDGFVGITEDRVIPLRSLAASDDIIQFEGVNASRYYDRGGTFLSSCRDYRFDKVPDGKGGYVDKTLDCIRTIEKHQVDLVFGCGGDGTWRGIRDLINAGIPCIGIPNTVDNDSRATETTIGYDTAIAEAAEYIQKIRNTTLSMNTLIIVVVMGRNSGALTLNAGLAGQANIILIPEITFSTDKISEHVLHRKSLRKRGTVIACSEAIDYHQLEERLKETTKMDIKVEVIGRIQRGAAPNSRDKILGTIFGAEAINYALKGKQNCVLAMKNGIIVPVPIEEAVSESSSAKHIKRVSMQDPVLKAAKSIGICFGD